MLFNISLPDLSDISDNQNIDKIRGYLATLNDQLRYMMMNIDEDNLSQSLSDTINTSAEYTAQLKESIVRLGDNISSLNQTAEKISWLISDGGNSSNFSLTSTAASIISNSLNLQGYAKFTDLQNSGYSIINGSNIISGSISADKIQSYSITADKIQSYSITADKLSVSSLQSISANIGGWSISDDSISSSVYGQGSFYINSASSSDSCWLRAKNSLGNTTFYISKNGSCYFNGSYISGRTITADKISTDSNQRLNLINNYYGTNIGKSLYLNSENTFCRLFINPSGILTFDTGSGNTYFSFALNRNGSSYSLSLLNGSGSVIGTIPIQ